MKNPVRPLTAVCCALLVALAPLGCASRQKSSRDEGPRLTRADMKYANVSVEPFTVARDVSDTTQKHVDDAQETVVEQLSESGLFESVKLGSAPRGGKSLVVKGEVTKIKVVGSAARFWVGSMAGSSYMDVYVKLVDAASGAVVAQGEISSRSNAMTGGWSVGGADKAVPRRAGARIAEFVVNNAKK